MTPVASAAANTAIEPITYEEVMGKLRIMRARPAKGISGSYVPTNVDLMTGDIGDVWRVERGNGTEILKFEKVGENQFEFTKESIKS